MLRPSVARLPVLSAPVSTGTQPLTLVACSYQIHQPCAVEFITTVWVGPGGGGGGRNEQEVSTSAAKASVHFSAVGKTPAAQSTDCPLLHHLTATSYAFRMFAVKCCSKIQTDAVNCISICPPAACPPITHHGRTEPTYPRPVLLCGERSAIAFAFVLWVPVMLLV